MKDVIPTPNTVKSRESCLYTLREDFSVWESGYDDGTIIIGSLNADKYIIVPEEKKATVLFIMNGLRSGKTLNEIEEDLRGRNIETDVGTFCKLMFFKFLLKRDGLLFDGKSSDPLSRSRDDLVAFSKTVANIEIRKNWISPEKLRYFPLIFFWVLFGVSLTAIGFLLFFLKGNWGKLIEEFYVIRTYPFLSAPFLLVGMVILVFLSFSVHETGHILMARKYGLYLKRIKIRLYMYFQIYISVQIPGLCTLKPKERAAVSIAGPGANLILASLAVIGYMVLPSTFSMLKILIGMMAVLNISFFIGNLYPFMPTDGYHFMTAVIFHHPDIKSAVVQRIRSKTLKTAHAKEKIYFIFYLVSMALILYISNSVIVSLTNVLNNKIPIQILHIPISIGGIIVINYLLLRRMYNFFKGK